MYHEKERAESALSDFFLVMKKGHHAPSSILGMLMLSVQKKRTTHK